jgi:hypothetical protein
LQILAELLEIRLDLLELALIVLRALCRVNLGEKGAACNACDGHHSPRQDYRLFGHTQAVVSAV